MRVGSLFAGIGGFDLAAEWCGWETAWYAEIDPYASATMRENYPNAVNHGDVTKIDGRAVEPVDLLCGGFPCQDISLAGKGAGLTGARSGLWKEYLRLIEEIRPRWIVIENVAALRTRGLEKVLSDLDALLYVGEGHCIPASAVGANHRRDRIWIIAYSLSHALRQFPERHQQYTALGWDSLFGDYGAQEPVADAGLESLDRVHGEGGAERGGAAAPEGAVDAHEPGRRGDHARETDVADALGAGLEGHAGDEPRGAGRAEPDGSARAEGVCGAGPRAIPDATGERCKGVVAEPSGDRERVSGDARGDGEVRYVPDADGAGCALVLEGEEGSQVERGDGCGYASGARGLAGCPTAEWWAVEPDMGRSLDGFSSWLDGAGRLEAHKLYLAYANATEGGPEEIVRAVRRAASEVGDWRAARGSDSVSPATILLTYVRKLTGDGEERDAPLARAAAEEIELRGVRQRQESRGAPRGPESGKQRPRKRANSLQALSWLLARYAEKAWLAYRRENAALGFGWEEGIGRVANGVPSRVDRLRCLGNAIVPQVAYVLFRAIDAREREWAAERELAGAD